MRLIALAALVGLSAIAALPDLAAAQKRVALVIGNAAYQHTSKLANPRNDATDMSAALKKHGFQVVEGFDLDKAAFDRKVRDFATALQGAEVGVFFFAGHGLQVSGHNYLVPVDAQFGSASALDFETVRLDLVHRTMERETQTNILFLDACRDNPLARNLARAMGTRSSEIGRGLAAVESGVGTLISFSTQPGNVALDGTGRNSPFAGALIKHMAASSDDLSAILIATRNDVMKETQRKQVPWEHSALTGRFYFRGAPPPAPPPQISEVERAWAAIQGTKSIAVLEDFNARFKDTLYAGLARERIEELKKQQVVIMPPPAPAPAKPAPPATVTPTPTPPPSPVRCNGFEALVGSERRCLMPASGKTEWFKDCPNCPEMVVAPTGSFAMGSPSDEPERSHREDQVAVKVGKAFAVGRFAVTRGEFAAFVTATGRKTDGGCRFFTGSDWKDQTTRNWRSVGFSQTDRDPVVCVNWNDAKAYVAWLSSTTGKTYRLLSEAEREYVTRAGSMTPFWWGSTISTSQANYDGSRRPRPPAGFGIREPHDWGPMGELRKATVPVDTFAANPWGLYNVHGNVWEWTEDCRNDNNAGNPGDGSARTGGDCSFRVIRGGTWLSFPADLRSAARFWYSPRHRISSLGFRVARALD